MGRLPVIKACGKEFFVDARLQEIRNVKNPLEVYRFTNRYDPLDIIQMYELGCDELEMELALEVCGITIPKVNPVEGLVHAEEAQERAAGLKPNPNERVYSCFCCKQKIMFGTKMVEHPEAGWVAIHGLGCPPSKDAAMEMVRNTEISAPMPFGPRSGQQALGRIVRSEVSNVAV